MDLTMEAQELRKRKRDQLIRLMEVSDLTKQLGEAMDRKDEMSVKMVVSMRQTPLQQVDEIEQGIQRYLMTLSAESAIRCNELLHGAPPEAPEEEPLCQQVAAYQRVLESTVAADQRLSLRLGGNQSFYRKFRGS